MDLFWYFNRLRTISFSELPYRFFQQAQKHLEKRQIGKSVFVPNYETKTCLPVVKIEKEQMPLFKPTINVFGKTFDYSANGIDWHKDLFSGKSFPLKFSKSMSIRSDKNLSAKNVWEINRLLFLPQIAVNYAATKDEKYLRQFVEINESWLQNNPYLLGINWYSNIEVNIRLINWFLTWEILNVEKIEFSWFKSFVNNSWMPCIYRHFIYSYHNPSLFSSANNHLISEYAGLFIAASKWNFQESDKWMKYAKRGLEKEIVKQHSNGVNREEAAEYIQFITDFFFIAYIVAENTNNPFSENYKKTLFKIFEYIFDFSDCKTHFPQYGDEDDGKVVLFSQETHFNNFKSLLASAAIIFNDERFKSKSKGFDLKNSILFGNAGEDTFVSVPNNNIVQNSSFYEQEGHFIFRKQETGKEIYLHFDAAPLGYLSIAAHGHADALSFILNVNGIPVFIDSGTYSYHVSKEWREYFVSTLAHNTICIDSKNQADHIGDTMWLNHYKCKVLNVNRNSELESVKAVHNGYKGISHIREIIFDKRKNCFTLVDEIKISDHKKRKITLPFHLHPEVSILSQTERIYTLNHQSGINVTLELDEKLSDSLVCGNESPILGWYSSSFLQKCPANVIVSETMTNKTITLISNIIINKY